MFLADFMLNLLLRRWLWAIEKRSHIHEKIISHRLGQNEKIRVMLEESFLQVCLVTDIDSGFGDDIATAFGKIGNLEEYFSQVCGV